MKVTLKDIARRLGISHATVSLALNNSPKVAEGTRKRVLATAKEMGYRASPYVSALMAARRRGEDPEDAPVIAMVTPNRTPDYWKERYHIRRFIEGCSATALSLGIRTELFWIGEKGMTGKRMNEILCNRGIRGAVLMSHGVWGERMDYPWRDLATVTYGARSLTPDTDWIGADFYGNMETALGVIVSHGFRRIGFTMDVPFPYAQHNRWLSAYLMEQNLKKIKRMKPWLDEKPDFEGFQSWFERARPEVIICVRPKTLTDWLHRLGLKIGKDVGLVAIGTAEKGGLISGIEENTQTCGKLAMEMLIDRIHRGQFGPYGEPQHVVVKGSWNEGKTLQID